MSKKLSTVDNSTVRLFFEDEASFGRISEPKYCWCAKGMRPIVPKQRVREYRNVFGAVEPASGEFFYQIEEPDKPPARKIGRRKKYARKAKPKPKKKGDKSRETNAFLLSLAKRYPNDHIVLACDNAWWHKSQYTKIPENMSLVYIPPYTPEMNPIEQVWREIRTRIGNTYFRTIDEVVETLRDTISTIQPETMKSITQRDWFMKPIILKTG